MDLSELKEKIHAKVDSSDIKVLEVVYLLLEDQSFTDFELTDKEAKEIDRDIDDFLSGKTKGYTIQEIRSGLKK